MDDKKNTYTFIYTIYFNRNLTRLNYNSLFINSIKIIISKKNIFFFSVEVITYLAY